MVNIYNRFTTRGRSLTFVFLFFSFFCFVQLRTPLGGVLLYMYLAGLVGFLFAYFKHVLNGIDGVFLKAPIMTLFIIWCFASIFWSYAPSITVERLVYLFITIGATALITQYLSVENCYKNLKIFCRFVIVLDLSIIVLVPSIGIMSGFSGLHYEKNQFGTIMAICSLALAILPDRRKIDVIFFILSMTFLYLSESKTSLYLVVILISLFSLNLLKIRVPRTGPITVFIIFAVVGLFMSLFFNDVTQYIEKSLDDEFMTGRAQIWKITLGFAENDLVGAGYGAFWGLGNLSSFKVLFFTPGTEWMNIIEQGHNGYLDMYATLGTIGVSLFLVSILMHLKHILESPEFPERRFILAFYIFTVLHNFSETSFLYFCAPVWVIFWINFHVVEFQAKNEI